MDTLDSSSESRHNLIVALHQDLVNKIGRFEGELLEKVEFANVDLDDPKNAYHIDVLKALVVKGLVDHESLVSGILKKFGLTKENIQQVIIESFTVEDIGLDIGTKRNVDLFRIILNDNKEVSFTVSVDKYGNENIENSPSISEAKTLKNIYTAKMQCVQKYFGHTAYIDSQGLSRGVICKEFLPGMMLGNYTADLQFAVEQMGAQAIKNIAYATGKMIGYSMKNLGGIPSDSNPLNIIIDQSADGEISARFCDVEALRTNNKDIEHETGALKNCFGRFQKDFLQGISDFQ